jgi:S1-C subfamily serine protease
MSNPHRIAIALFLTLVYVAPAAAAQDEIRNSVVHVFATQRAPNFGQPWTKLPPREGTGTGFVIEGNRILTNAHVVQYAGQLYVQPNQSADKIPAKVVAVSPGIDLAVLSIEDEEFFKTRPPIPMSEGFPKVRSAVNVYGFPIGGQQMSVTEGIISRVEYSSYNFQTSGLIVQIDAALNPGNSGGPAVSDGKLVGVAFSGLRSADNIGYLIPVEEIITFLADVADGSYQGKPQMFDDLQTVENDALRARLGLAKGVGGAMVRAPLKTDDDYPLKEWDVITHIGPHAIDAGAKVVVADDQQLPFTYYVPKLTKDGKVPLKVLREGKEIDVELPVSIEKPSIFPYLRGKYPSYFIYGPLVFSSVSRELVGALGQSQQALFNDRGLEILRHAKDAPSFEGEELVVVPCPMFSHAITKSYGTPVLGVVAEVNNVKVKNLAHLAELLRDAKGEFIEFKFASNSSETLVFRREEIAASTEEILNDNGIRSQWSDDLESVWKAAKN